METRVTANLTIERIDTCQILGRLLQDPRPGGEPWRSHKQSNRLEVLGHLTKISCALGPSKGPLGDLTPPEGRGITRQYIAPVKEFMNGGYSTAVTFA